MPMPLICFSRVQFFNVVLKYASYMHFVWTLPLFKHTLAHFSKPNFIFIFLLIVCKFSFHSSNHSHFYLAVSSYPYTISDLFSSQLLLLLLLLLLTATELSPGGSGYFTCIQNLKLVTNKFKSGGLHEKHVVATWSSGNYLSICL